MRWRLPLLWPYPTPNEIESRFEQLVHGRWGADEGEVPADVFVAEQWVEVWIDLPGVRESSVRARIDDGFLVVQAEREAPRSSEHARPARLDRPRGGVQLRVRLPVNIEVHRAEVQYGLESGVLHVRVHLGERA